ncbi:MAG: extracellular solute-binding protein [Phycisphaerae bacterium]|nr:extracellular solute-binding protein [Phycisphaerae bacterium]MDW8261707.1 extracellular solute-binding protein [Phycisphaerales bacterium]
MPANPSAFRSHRLKVVLSLLLAWSGTLHSGCDRKNQDGPIRLELWTLALRPRFTHYMEDLIARFERQRPDIDVVWVDVPFDAVQRKYLAAAAARRAPDVINLSDGFYSRFVALGGVADLRAHLPGDPDQTYLPGALRLCRIDGKLHALPWYLGISVAFVNEKLLAEGGLSRQTLGTDWPTLRRQAEDFHRRTGKFLFCYMLGQETRLPQAILQQGLSPLRPKTSGEGLESNLDDPQILRFVSDWVEFYRRGAMPTEAAVGGHGPMIDLYQNGQTAMLITGANFLERIRDAAPDVYRHTAVLPAPRGAAGKFDIATMLLCVSSQSQHPREAAELAWFITNPENQLAFARIVNILPSTPASLRDPHFAFPPDPEQDKLGYARALSAQSLAEAQSFILPLAAWPELGRAFEERIKAALLDGADVARTLSQISRDWNRILDSYAPATLVSDPVSGTHQTGKGAS